MISTKRRVAIIDDDRDFSLSLIELLEVEGYTVTAYSSAIIALQQIDAEFDGVVLLDIRMPEISGEDVLPRLLKKDHTLPVIHITGHGDIPMAVKAVKNGAYSFFSKPLDIDELLRDLNKALTARSVELERRALASQITMRDDLETTVLGASIDIKKTRKRLVKISKSAVDVLVYGETGTGKELVSKEIVRLSDRKNAPFEAINCGHLTHLQATESLFGVETLLPSGETNTQIGKFEQANNGTVLLDEIESMPMEMQAKLLRVLQERKLERINSSTVQPLDLRVIATTKVNLLDKVKDGSFREDLFYRLSGVEIRLPPLRDRGTDAVLLFTHFLAELKFSTDISPGLMSDILSHDWPGNVRELRNAANRYEAGLGIFTNEEMDRKNSLAARVASFEKSLIELTLAQNAGSLKRTMLDLDVPRKTLYDKMTRHNISKEQFSQDE